MVENKYELPKGQEKIIAAINAKDPVALWREVKFIGYKQIPSMNMRKVIFYDAWMRYDFNINNNFVAYYFSKIKYASLDYYKRMNAVLTQDNRAHKSYSRKLNWELEDDKIVNQNENILQSFYFPNPLYN